MLLVAACSPPATAERSFAYIWYVATTGSDSNRCDSPATPCATLEGVFRKARAEDTRLAGEHADLGAVYHTVNVAAGSYLVSGRHDGAPFAHADINVTIIGAGQESTIFDAGDVYGGLFISGDVHVQVRRITIQNVRGTAPDSCINVRGEARATIENTTVRRCHKSGIAHFSNGALTLINVTATGNLTDAGGNGNGVSSLNELHIQGGSFSGNEGSGIQSVGSLTASDVLVENNQRDGLAVNGSAELVNLTLRNNGLDLSFRAGLQVNGGDVSLLNSRIANNQYGVRVLGGLLRLAETVVTENPRTGVLVEGGEVRITDSTLSSNGSMYYGTGLPGAVSNLGRLFIRNTLIVGNSNGGILNADSGELAVVESSLVENHGGMPALFNSGVARVERSLIANNTIDQVVTTNSAVENRGSMVIENSTISGNNGVGVGAIQGRLALAYATIAENDSIGLMAIEGAAVVSNISNSLIAKNGAAECELSTAVGVSPFPLSGYNLSTDASCRFPGRSPDAEINLGPLADNGGPTFTHALLSGSPALEAALGPCPANDQRNLARPVGPACDLGAYEAGATALSLEEGDFEFDLATATPVPLGVLVAIPDRNYNCRYGNSSSQFEIADTLLEGVEYMPIGIGADKLWLQFSGPSFGELCWAPTEGFSLQLNGQEVTVDALPETLLQTVIYPPVPSPTPTSTFTPEPETTPTCTPQQIQNQQCP